MKGLSSLLLCVALLSSCTDPESMAPVQKSDAEALMSALESEPWTQEVPFDLGSFADVRTSRAAQEDAVSVVQISSLGATGATDDGSVQIIYMVFETDEEATGFVVDFAADFAGHKDARPLQGLPGICVVDADKADECTTAHGNVMVRVFSRLGGIADEEQTEELLDLALAHLNAVRKEANL